MTTYRFDLTEEQLNTVHAALKLHHEVAKEALDFRSCLDAADPWYQDLVPTLPGPPEQETE